MYELIQVTQRCYYIQSLAKIGLIQVEKDKVCLIDSGNDKDAGKKVKKILHALYVRWALTEREYTRQLCFMKPSCVRCQGKVHMYRSIRKMRS